MKVVQFSPLDGIELKEIERDDFVGQSQELGALFEMAEKAQVDTITIPELREDANFAVKGIILATAIEVSDPEATISKVSDCLSSDGSAFILKELYSRVLKKGLELPDDPSSRTILVSSLYFGREFRNRTIVI
jgi:hypothetical protein